MLFKQYDSVVLTSVPQLDAPEFLRHNLRLPRIGDVGVIIEVYSAPSLGYEVECSEVGTGITQWMHTFDDVGLRNISCNAV